MSNLRTITRAYSGATQLTQIAFVLAMSALTGCAVCAADDSPQTAKPDDEPKAVVTGITLVSVYRLEEGKSPTYVNDSTEVLPSELEFEILLAAGYPEQSSSWRSWSVLDLFVRPAHARGEFFGSPEPVVASYSYRVTASSSDGSRLRPQVDALKIYYGERS